MGGGSLGEQWGIQSVLLEPERQYAPNAVAGFNLFELPTLARLMERAIDVNEKETTRLEKFKQRRSLEAFSESSVQP